MKSIKHKNKTPRDDEYVQAYLETESQIKAAKLCGVSRETIARAVRRANIEMLGRKNNGKKQSCKITDQQIKSESKKMTGYEICHKYGISPMRLSKRASKIGIKLDFPATGRWRQRALFYGCKEFDRTITIEALRERDKDICQICGLPVDDTDIKNGYIRKNYPTLDHIIPLSKGGTHTWGNVRLAHMACNAGKCDKLIYTVKREEVWT